MSVEPTPVRRSRVRGASKTLKARARAASVCELAFIPHASFRKANSKDSSPEAEFVEAIESGQRPEGRTEASALPAHLARMSATPLLTPEQESLIFRRMNFCKSRANSVRATIDPEAPSAEDVREFEDLVRRSERLRNHLIEANTRLVMSIARKFSDERNSFDELLSQGVASLMHAVEKFDFGRGFRFSTYATCAVRRDLYRMVMGRKKELVRFATGCEERLEGAEPAQEGIDERSWQTLSGAMDRMLECLDSRERTILEARFGLDGSRKRTSYSKLGKELGISKERVRQLANRALDRLRDVVGEYRLESMLP